MSHLTKGAPTLADIQEEGLYTAKEVAAVLRLAVDTIYRLGAMKVLRCIYLGPRGGKTRFLGIDVLNYAKGKAA